MTMQADLIQHGFVIRGAVTKGKILHNQKMIFGPALVAAYKLENFDAKYPRIIVSDDIIEVATKAHSCNHTSRHEQEYIEKMLRIDDDGLHYIDYFNEVKSEFDDPGYDYPQYLDIMRN
ncbi:MAG: hypothetical protein KAJ75_05100 [Alphaproteobacteria bacterium]|nr:hypothetical protein [Alphaproteobacteria bacterium]